MNIMEEILEIRSWIQIFVSDIKIYTISVRYTVTKQLQGIHTSM